MIAYPHEEEMLRRSLRRFYILSAEDEEIKEDEVAFISSGMEWGVKSLTVYGELRNDGVIVIRETLTNKGRIVNRGRIEVGW